MFCTECGAPNEEDAAFCTNCGATFDADGSEISEAPIAYPATSPVMAQAVAASATRKNSKLPIIVSVIVALTVIICVIVWFAMDQANKARHAPHAITVSINAAGYSDQDTLIPVRAHGYDLDDNEVDELFFVDSLGEGIALPKGEYELTVEASPLTADGILYRDSAATYEVILDDELENEEAVDLSGEVTIVLDKSTALDETQDMIDAAYEAAIKDPDQVDKADELRDKASSVHQEAVHVKEREDAARAERERQEVWEANWVRTAREGLNVPSSGDITYKVDFSGPGSYWEGAGIYLRSIYFYQNGKMCATASCDADTGEPVRSMLLYPGLLDM